MRIPAWLTIAAAIFVTGFGVFRIYVALRKPPEEPPKRGFYRMGSRMHFMVGLLYLVLGGALFAVSFGWNPFGTYFSGPSKVPPKDEAPSKTPIPIDQLPTKK
jgi:hypothetical protein